MRSVLYDRPELFVLAPVKNTIKERPKDEVQGKKKENESKDDFDKMLVAQIASLTNF